METYNMENVLCSDIVADDRLFAENFTNAIPAEDFDGADEV